MRVRAYAKLNLSLYVGERRPDGYHNLDGVMQSVSLCDILDIEKADKISVTCSVPELSGEKNLVYKAAKLFFEECGILGGTEIYLQKNIPFPSGLGGGSSDAAAVLVALNKMYETGISEDGLEKMAVKLGADVPFFIRGGTQRAEGVGDVLTALNPIADCCFVIAINGDKSSTREMYERIDGNAVEGIDIEKSVSALMDGSIEKIAKACNNSFARVAGVYSIDKILSPSLPLAVSLSGSGPSVFALYRCAADADVGCGLLKKLGIEHYKVTPTPSGIEIE